MTDLLPATVLDAVIDVSHWNGAIDWHAVAAAGIALAFIKATEGEREVDPMFAANVSGAAAAGIMTAPYHFIDAGVGAAPQAQHFLTVTGLKTGQPAMLDWETAAGVDAVVAIGAAVAEATGRDPVGYYGWAQLRAADPALSRWPLMLPEYPQGDTPGDYASLVRRVPRLPPGRDKVRPYDFHQYTRVGQVPGINGGVDRSVWVGTRDELVVWFKTGARPLTQPRPLPVPQNPPAPATGAKPLPDDPKVLQSFLASSGVYSGPIDGIVGPETQAAVGTYYAR